MRDAEAFDAEVRRRRRTGDLMMVDAGKQTLAEFAEEWWRGHAVPDLAPSTRRRYAEVWDLHVLPRLGGYRLRQVTPAVVDRFAPTLRLRSGRPPFSRR